MSQAPVSVLVIGDPHFKVSNVKDTDRMSEEILKIAKDKKPTFIVCLGDVLDRHETIHVTPLSRASEFLYSLTQVARTFVIIGNHDRPNNSTFLTEEHPFNSLKHWDNCTVIDKPQKVNINNFEFVFVPYVYPGRYYEALSSLVPIQDSIDTKDTNKDTEVKDSDVKENNDIKTENSKEITKDNNVKENTKNTKENLKELEDIKTQKLVEDHLLNNVTCVFSHQEFLGAKMGAIISDQGDKWSSNSPLNVSGHIHDYDELQHNLIYTGTPIQHSFGDKSDKTISLFTFHGRNDIKNSQELSISHNTVFLHQRIDLRLPRKTIIHLTPEQVDSFKESLEGKDVKIIITGTTAVLKTIMKTTKVKAWCASGIKVIYKDIPNDLKPMSPQKTRMIKYSELLYLKCLKTPDLKPLYEKLFGGKPVSQSICSSGDSFTITKA